MAEILQKDGGQVWLTMEQVCATAGWKPRTVRHRAAINLLVSRPGESRGPNGKREREYALSSLPADAQVKFLKSQAASETAIVIRPDAILSRASSPEAQARMPVPPGETLPLFAATPPVAPEQRFELDPEDRKEADRRLEIIAPLIEFKQRTNGHRPQIRVASGKVARNLNDLAEWLAAQHQVSASSIWRWFIAWQKGGYIALGRKARKDRGRSRAIESNAVLAAFLQHKYLNEGELTGQLIYDAMLREWPRLAQKNTEPPPGYATLRRYLSKIPLAIKTLAREGERAWEGKRSPFIMRGSMPAMEWWVADHRVFDVLVRNTVFFESRVETLDRLWLTAVYDWGSRAMVGYCVAPNPSSRTINSALRMAVLNYGFPKNLYWDNGKDFRKVRDDLELIMLSEGAQELLQRRAIGFTSAIPKRPRSKPIESWFAGWSKRFDVLWHSGYIGNRAGGCPESGRESQLQHRLYLKGRRADSPVPLDVHFILATRQWIFEYNEKPKELLGGRSPLQVMEEQHPLAGREQISARTLDLLCSDRDVRVVQRGGCVHLDRLQYEPTDASRYALDLRQGKKVLIARDPYNLDEAIAFDSETKEFVGELQIQECIAQCPNGHITRDLIQARLRQERSIKRSYREYCATFAAIADVAGWKTEREALLERAGVRTGTDGRRAAIAAAAPGAMPRLREGPRPQLASPFVDDRAEAFIQAMEKDDDA